MAGELATQLTSALYSLSELEFFYPDQQFEKEKVAVSLLIDRVCKLQTLEFQAFAGEVTLTIANYCIDPTRDANALYRAFDRLDEVLAIDYSERPGFATGVSERLYECSGAKVQTAYSSIFQVLERLQLRQNAHLIDLGSGFGRVGLGVGLWRSDLRFTGYEFVETRVTASNHAAKKAGLDERVQFFAQDLSDLNFKIPFADAYYLYDPFSESTYRRVIAQILEVGRRQRTFVIAKGAATDHFLSSWELVESIDHGNLQIFTSRKNI